jgi:hypothetical protein
MKNTNEQSHHVPAQLTPPPDWINQLIIYEIATKAFTSPAGPESGTFDSLRDKLPYLHELGVTGIWLTGHSLADPKHFYNIWTQYACILPDELDPSLGSPESFKQLIDTAHDLNLKVFLDVITHGVMNDSPLIRQKPHWFKGGTWGMTDYDWFGGHKDLDDWWVNLWVRYVEELGIDGFRLDVATYRPDLWSKIRKRATGIGHPIVIIAENGPGYTGVTDFLQRGGYRLSIQTEGLNPNSPLLSNVAAFIKQAVQPPHDEYRVLIHYADGTSASNYGEGQHALHVAYRDEREKSVAGEDGQPAYIHHETVLEVSDAPANQEIENIVVTDWMGQQWWLKGFVEVDYAVKIEGAAPVFRLVFPVKYPPQQWLSVQLSSHDDGWDGYPLNKNPYTAQGSRFVFGYSFLLTPAIPLFMAGEEFNADFVPLPTLSPKLYGGENPGQGRWLYGSWIQWEQLAGRDHAEMLDDVKRLIRIRRENPSLIHPLKVGDGCDHLISVPYSAQRELPVPYLYWNERRGILVAGNPDPSRDATIRFDVPFASIGFEPAQRIAVTDLWNEDETTITTAEAFNEMQFTIKRDKAHRGGMLVVAIDKA